MKKENKLHSPIIFIGMGRSGSSIIYEAFANHFQLAFFSQYCTKGPLLPHFTFIHRFFSNYRKKEQWEKQTKLSKLRPNPKEAYNIWERLCGEKFRNSFLRNLKPTEKERNNILRYISSLLFYQHKNRFVMKITGPPRIEYLSGVFDTPVFIEIIRDPRAVVYSLLNVEFRKKKGLQTPNWHDSLSEEDVKEWESYDKNPIALAALEWRSVYRQTKEELLKIKPYYKLIKYEEFVKDPQKIIVDILGFAGLSEEKRVVNYVNRMNYKNVNYKYFEGFSEQEIKMIEDICKKELEERNYI